MLQWRRPLGVQWGGGAQASPPFFFLDLGESVRVDSPWRMAVTDRTSKACASIARILYAAYPP